jgi:hypothetical protein
MTLSDKQVLYDNSSSHSAFLDQQQCYEAFFRPLTDATYFPRARTCFSTKSRNFPFCLDLVLSSAGSCSGIFKQSMVARNRVGIGLSHRAGIFKQSMRTRNRVGIGLSHRAGIFKQSMRTRNRVGIGLPYRPARLHRLAELFSWNRFIGSIKV